MTRLYVGIDPSLTNTALCVMNGGNQIVIKEVVSIPNQGKTAEARVRRAMMIVDGVMEIIEDLDNIHMIVIEGYSYGSKFGNEFLAEFGGILRMKLVERWPGRLFEIAPTTLKKFTTGKGNAKKAEMVSAITRKFSEMITNDDESDAIACAWMGVVACSRTKQTPQYQLECIAKLTGGSE